MMKLSCKDMGAECGFEATGMTKEEVKDKMMKHAMSEHKEMMDKMSENEKGEMMVKMDKMIKEEV
jgi:predicted small metal-binding protein